MFGNTVLLSVAATVTGSVLAALSYQSDRPELPLLVAGALAVPAAASVVRGSRRWRDPERRARVVATVAGG